MKDKAKKILNRKKANDRKIEKKTNIKNKKLMIEKILSYSPILSDGIEKYLDANRNFLFLIGLGMLLNDFPMIALPCCFLSMFFSVRMFQLIKYKTANGIIIEMAEDLAFKGIFNEDKVDIMLDNFKNKYGQDIIEYEELTKMINSYKTFVLKIESLLKNVNSTINDKQEYSEKTSLSNNIKTPFSSNKDNVIIVSKDDKLIQKVNFDDLKQDSNEKLSVLYRKKDGEIKKINRAIEFFDDCDDSYKKENAVILNSSDKNNDKLKVYLYKKNVGLQKNVL